MKDKILQLSAFSLRSASLLARFLLVVVVARALPPDSFGFFILYVATLQIGTAAASMDVYAETTRLFLDAPDQRQNILSRHFSFLGATGVIVGPLVGLAFFAYEGQFPIAVYLVFPVFFLTELYANDITRLLPPLQHPFAASVLLFVRQAIPLAIIFVLNEFSGSDLTLLKTIVITFGPAVPVIGIVLIMFRARSYYDTLLRLDLRWVRTTVQASAAFFAATLVFRVLFGIDRFIVASMTGLGTTGIYGLYVSFGMGIVSVLEAGVSAWKYPPLVRSILHRDSGAVIIQFSSFLITNLVSSVVMCLAAYFAIQYIVLNFLEPHYHAGLAHLHWILLGAIAISASLPFHYVLFGLRRDRALLAIYCCAVAAVMLYALLVLKGGGVGEAFGVFVVATTVIGAGRMAFAFGPLKSIRQGHWS
ncbi:MULTISPECIES: lipopolysaccharide biosynthesis protein [unclassified Sulfitobacter]|uniref:lipopolysaccharide biosynthesis protein n=1 Tax=unclassified Sulfitobacter TaxID=196795 RepID=UPI003746108F